MFPKKKRITKEIFQNIIKNGKVLHGSLFLFKYINSDQAQYSFVVPKNIAKKATIRNKFRRLGYNILSKKGPKSNIGIFFYKKDALKVNKEDLEKDIFNILGKI